VYALAVSGAEAFAFAPATSLASRSPLALRQTSSQAVATTRLASVTRPQRKLGARLASTKMAIAAESSIARVIENKPKNNAELFEKTYDMVIVGSGPVALTAAISAVAQSRSVIMVDSTAEDAVPFEACVFSSTLGRVGALKGTDCHTLTYRHALAEAALTIDYDVAAAGKDSLSKSELEKGLKTAGWSGSDVSTLMAGVSSDSVSRDDFLAARNIASSVNPLLGVSIRSASDWAKVQPRIESLLVKNHDENMATLEDRGIPHLRGESYVEGQGADKLWKVAVKGTAGAGDGTIKAHKVLVATGSRSLTAEGVTYDPKAGVFDGDSIQSLSYSPKEMTIVGTQLTMLEYARSFAALGTKVTLVIPSEAEFKANLVKAGSAEAGEKFLGQLKDSGVDIIMQDAMSSVDSSVDPVNNPITVKLASGKEIKTNALVTLMGRKANVDHLGIDRKDVGVACNTEGSILVDHNLETTAFGIYAAGDVVGGTWLANNGLDNVHSAIKSMFGLETMSERSMSSRHAGFLAKSYNAGGYAGSLEKTFPGVIDEESFIEMMTKVVNEKGFSPETSINLVSTCRDEICKPFTEKLDSMWSQHFSISSLGGFVFCGKTGFGAGMAHAPIDQSGKERYVFWAAPHIAYGVQHVAGRVYRPGRDGPSSACGALIALQGELDAGKSLNIALDPDDTEMSLVRQQVLGKLDYGDIPNLVDITYAAHECILDQVKGTAEAVVNKEMCEYVIISGIQIHGALGKNFMWPGTIKMYSNGVETDLTADYNEAVKDYKLNDWLQSEALSQVKAVSKGGRLPAIYSDIKL